ERVADMAGRVPRGPDDAGHATRDLDLVTVTDGPVDTGDLRLLVFGTDDGQPVALLKGEVRFHMVAMVMGDEQARGLPARALHRRDDRRLFGRIEQEGLARRGIPRQDAEIVAAAHELIDLEGHVILLAVGNHRIVRPGCHPRHRFPYRMPFAALKGLPPPTT